MKRYINILIFILLGLSITSCDDFFGVNPDDKLLGEDYPSTLTELYSGYMGVAAKAQTVADQAIYLEGLRGNLLEPTQNATNEIIDLYNYSDVSHSEFANPVGYYDVILNANDYLAHVTEYYEKNPTAIDQTTFDALIGGVLRYKAWAYLMLAKIYGEAVWLDDPLLQYKDITQYPTIGFDAVIDKCITLIETGIKINGRTGNITGKGRVRWSEILSTSESQWERFCPPAEALLTELYLFAGNYQKSIDNGFAMLRIGLEDSESKPSFQITLSDYNGDWKKIFRTYTRLETISLFLYDYDKNQSNHLIDYFYNGPSCKYLMRPTQAAIDLFRAQAQSGAGTGDTNRSFGGDGTNRDNAASFLFINGDWVMWKYISSRDGAAQVFRGETPVQIYRASDIHLFLVEALLHVERAVSDAAGNVTYKDRLTEAMALFEDGMAGYYDSKVKAFVSPFEDFPRTLYISSATEGYNVGVRTRVSLAKVGGPVVRNAALTLEEKRYALDKLVLDETYLESCGEARGLYAAIRMAKRWNDPSFVADRVSEKYPLGKREEIAQKLQNPANWFIKYDLKK
ncbi:hypothetical protein [Viscerimonas tarda]